MQGRTLHPTFRIPSFAFCFVSPLLSLFFHRFYFKTVLTVPSFIDLPNKKFVFFDKPISPYQISVYELKSVLHSHINMNK